MGEDPLDPQFANFPGKSPVLIQPSAWSARLAAGGPAPGQAVLTRYSVWLARTEVQILSHKRKNWRDKAGRGRVHRVYPVLLYITESRVIQHTPVGLSIAKHYKTKARKMLCGATAHCIMSLIQSNSPCLFRRPTLTPSVGRQERV